MKGTCVYCGQRVEDADTAAYLVTGWEIERMQGGANHIAARERVPDQVAHAVCLQSGIRRAKRGLGDAQESLL